MGLGVMFLFLFLMCVSVLSDPDYRVEGLKYLNRNPPLTPSCQVCVLYVGRLRPLNLDPVRPKFKRTRLVTSFSGLKRLRVKEGDIFRPLLVDGQCDNTPKL